MLRMVAPIAFSAPHGPRPVFARFFPQYTSTAVIGGAAGGFRIFLMPVDALKTIMQVEGKAGLPALGAKVRAGGPTVLYHGALAASAATFAGHYPWFATVRLGLRV